MVNTNALVKVPSLDFLQSLSSDQKVVLTKAVKLAESGKDGYPAKYPDVYIETDHKNITFSELYDLIGGEVEETIADVVGDIKPEPPVVIPEVVEPIVETKPVELKVEDATENTQDAEL